MFLLVWRIPYFIRVAAAQARRTIFIMHIDIFAADTGQAIDQSFLSLSS